MVLKRQRQTFLHIHMVVVTDCEHSTLNVISFSDFFLADFGRFPGGIFPCNVFKPLNPNKGKLFLCNHN